MRSWVQTPRPNVKSQVHWCVYGIHMLGSRCRRVPEIVRQSIQLVRSRSVRDQNRWRTMEEDTGIDSWSPHIPVWIHVPLLSHTKHKRQIKMSRYKYVPW